MINFSKTSLPVNIYNNVFQTPQHIIQQEQQVKQPKQKQLSQQQPIKVSQKIQQAYQFETNEIQDLQKIKQQQPQALTRGARHPRFGAQPIGMQFEMQENEQQIQYLPAEYVDWQEDDNMQYILQEQEQNIQREQKELERVETVYHSAYGGKQELPQQQQQFWDQFRSSYLQMNNRRREDLFSFVQDITGQQTEGEVYKLLSQALDNLQPDKTRKFHFYVNQAEQLHQGIKNKQEVMYHVDETEMVQQLFENTPMTPHERRLYDKLKSELIAQIQEGKITINEYSQKLEQFMMESYHRHNIRLSNQSMEDMKRMVRREIEEEQKQNQYPEQEQKEPEDEQQQQHLKNRMRNVISKVILSKAQQSQKQLKAIQNQQIDLQQQYDDITMQQQQLEEQLQNQQLSNQQRQKSQDEIDQLQQQLDDFREQIKNKDNDLQSLEGQLQQRDLQQQQLQTQIEQKNIYTQDIEGQLQKLQIESEQNIQMIKKQGEEHLKLLQDEIQLQQTQIQQQKEQQNADQSQIKDLMNEQQHLEQQHANMFTQVEEATQTILQLENQLNSHKNQTATIRLEEQKQFQQDIQQLREQMEQYKGEYKRVQHLLGLEKLRAKRREEEGVQKDKSVLQLENKIRQFGNKIEELQQQGTKTVDDTRTVLQLQKKLQQSTQQLEQKNEQNESLQSNESQLKQQMDEQSKLYEDEKQQWESQKQKIELQLSDIKNNKYAQKIAEVQQLQQEVASNQQVINILHNEIEKINSNVAGAGNEDKERLKQQLLETNDQLQSLESKNRKLEQQYTQIREKYNIKQEQEQQGYQHPGDAMYIQDEHQLLQQMYDDLQQENDRYFNLVKQVNREQHQLMSILQNYGVDQFQIQGYLGTLEALQQQQGIAQRFEELKPEDVQQIQPMVFEYKKNMTGLHMVKAAIDSQNLEMNKLRNLVREQNHNITVLEENLHALQRQIGELQRQGKNVRDLQQQYEQQTMQQQDIISNLTLNLQRMQEDNQQLSLQRREQPDQFNISVIENLRLEVAQLFDENTRLRQQISELPQNSQQQQDYESQIKQNEQIIRNTKDNIQLASPDIRQMNQEQQQKFYSPQVAHYEKQEQQQGGSELSDESLFEQQRDSLDDRKYIDVNDYRDQFFNENFKPSQRSIQQWQQYYWSIGSSRFVRPITYDYKDQFIKSSLQYLNKFHPTQNVHQRVQMHHRNDEYFQSLGRFINLITNKGHDQLEDIKKQLNSKIYNTQYNKFVLDDINQLLKNIPQGGADVQKKKTRSPVSSGQEEQRQGKRSSQRQNTEPSQGQKVNNFVQQQESEGSEQIGYGSLKHIGQKNKQPEQQSGFIPYFGNFQL